jgi:type IV secretion system protein VirB10
VTGNEPDAKTSNVATEPQSPEESKAAVRLSGEWPRAVRLSRKIIGGGSALILLVIASAIMWALQRNQLHEQPSSEPSGTQHRTVADGLTALPRDYASVPHETPPLGPPLPGGFGRVAVSADGKVSAVDAEQQRAKEEAEAARTSKLFAQANVAGSNQPAKAELASDRASAADESSAQNGQDRKLAFAGASVDRRTAAPDRIASPGSPFIVQAGTAIPAALITGIRSDLPGQITAQVTENVYDSPTGRWKLVPQGARLIGVYDSQISFGQSRVQLVWTRLIMPNGRSIVLERQQGADGGGYAGLEDEVDNHWGELFEAALLSTVLSVGAETNSGADGTNNAAILQALRLGASNSVNETGQQVVRRHLNVQPTLTIRPGFHVRVIVNRDLMLEPYRG